jgi:hypothetical protein
VADGYDTRVTMNRYALYGGIFLGAAAVGSITALAAFNTGSDALIAIPIGTTFVSTMFGAYQSEDKARIYELGTKYIKDLIELSESRLQMRKLAAANPEKSAQDARDVAIKAQKSLQDKTQTLQTITNDIKTAREAAASSTDENAKKAASDRASALERSLPSLQTEAQAAKDAADLANRRLYELESLKTAWQNRTQSPQGWDVLSQHDQWEAICLTQDMNDLMRRVSEHLALLDPKNVAEYLKSVQSKASPSSSTSSSTPTMGSTISLGDLSDLKPPVKSICDGVYSNVSMLASNTVGNGLSLTVTINATRYILGKSVTITTTLPRAFTAMSLVMRRMGEVGSTDWATVTPQVTKDGLTGTFTSACAACENGDEVEIGLGLKFTPEGDIEYTPAKNHPILYKTLQDSQVRLKVGNVQIPSVASESTFSVVYPINAGKAFKGFDPKASALKAKSIDGPAVTLQRGSCVQASNTDPLTCPYTINLNGTLQGAKTYTIELDWTGDKPDVADKLILG